jgi:OOP family OmpA-OmpF porin
VNPGVNIEIQGHVNGEGTKKMKSKRLSKKRAKSILFYLVEAGVSQERLSTKGYGFTKPIFKAPENEMQKEANRRVDILIK